VVDADWPGFPWFSAGSESGGSMVVVIAARAYRAAIPATASGIYDFLRAMCRIFRFCLRMRPPGRALIRRCISLNNCARLAGSIN
jgi:hypothetical protein